MITLIHSFIPAISIAPLQVLYYSEALPTTAWILYVSEFLTQRTGNCRNSLSSHQFGKCIIFIIIITIFIIIIIIIIIISFKLLLSFYPCLLTVRVIPQDFKKLGITSLLLLLLYFLP